MDDDRYFESEDFRELLAQYEYNLEYGHRIYLDADELCDLADYYMTQGEDEKAIDATKRALELHPDSCEPVTMMGDILYDLGRYEEAIPWVNKALDNDPYDIESWLNLAEAQAQLELYAQSEDSCEFALAIEPDNQQALLTLAYSVSQQERYTEAQEHYDRILARQPDDELTLYHSAVNLCFLQRYEEANIQLRHARETCPPDSMELPQILLQQAFTEAHCGNLDDAISALDSANKANDPQFPIDYEILLGHIYLISGKATEAGRCFETALHDNEKYYHSARLIGLAYMDCEYYDQASYYLGIVLYSALKDDSNEESMKIARQTVAPLAYCLYYTDKTELYRQALVIGARLNPEDMKRHFRNIFPSSLKPEDYINCSNRY